MGDKIISLQNNDFYKDIIKDIFDNNEISSQLINNFDLKNRFRLT